MSFYEDRILPHIIDKACSMGQVMKLRSQVVPEARGTVLEVGMGSAINLDFYDPSIVERIYGLEPSAGMRRKAQANLQRSGIPVEWLDLPGEKIPLEDNSVDTVLLTFTLCTIPDWHAALLQMKRVLRPGGSLLFLEHGESPDEATRKWQHRITPGWRKLAGGCHLNRQIADLIKEAGFEIQTLENLYIPKSPKIAGYVYKGRAIKPGEG
ncbi:class I SAM-dependent methyltransferase [Marinobacter daepoensis]|uniref:Methyltransferase domain-containing protein n=1 Tax=Marinobacter daepoensis TaxID=262077 RepID=A0ABS3BBQ6_9GAMM|nr:class I SAM-dependent methyltransferase [Marinobacter daepoensis]MBN7769031.1 methyltransferase domain-containing protein [Marinobacter daepoensis]MBY6032364.1 class I SAM-dependent methyltransferase [Marinobacter daepoensis]MBY6077721.1 class I SAM-dependent methyltransferase [Marinobacter daepoensis]